MKLHSVLWIEDDAEIVNGIIENFSEDKEERGYNIMPSHFLSLKKMKEDPDMEISSIVMTLVCVDYNLPDGVNGNDIIKIIRSYKANKEVPIIFYSFAKNEIELQQILESTIDNTSDIYYAHQDDLEERMILLLEE
jgi:DNA-binding response OmpR family regulator